jgi:RNA polymerase sigma-70 factor, ECF subfamily
MNALNSTAQTKHDEAAFARLVEPHRAALQAHCYRMLGSMPDAEDALQETLLRAWRGLPGFEGRSSLSSWLYRIATNVCLKAIERRPKRVLPVDYGPPADPHDALEAPPVESIWLGPYPDETVDDAQPSPEARYEQRETVELAFVAALQHLPPRQRAVLLLRDVLGFAPSEIATALDATPASIYSTLQRAHEAVEERLPERTQQATLRSIGDDRLRALVERYVQAWEDADVAAITAMLTDDATFAMPPRPSWYRGRAAVGAFLAAYPLSRPRRWRRLPARVNGQLSFGIYGDSRAHAIEVLTLNDAAQLTDVTTFHQPDLFRRFGLPDSIEP